MVGLQFLLPSSETPRRQDAPAQRRPRLVTVPPLPEYAAILANPVFAPDRRTGETGVSTPGAGALDAFAALGAATGGGAATAVVAGPGGVSHAMHRGDVLEGWRLVAIEREALVFQRGGERRTLAIGAPARTLSQAAATPGSQAPSDQ